MRLAGSADAMDAVLTLASLLVAGIFFWLYRRERSMRLSLAAELARASHQIATNQVRDELTGLLSRSGFDPVLDRAVWRVDAGGGAFCVLYLALDNFGLLNDAFGQNLGDRLLQSVSRRLAQCSEEQAEVCRVNSGEFVFIVNGDMAAGRAAAQRVAEALTQPFKFDAIKTQINCSIGIAQYPEHGARTKLLAHAALAMRSIKLNGGGGFCEYDLKMGVAVHDQAVLLNDLRGALDAGQFELYFQPKVDALSLQVTAAEALLRWHHPMRGMVSPAEFIPIAESSGLIVDIGEWVFQQASAQVQAWRKDLADDFQISVNKSPVQFHHSGTRKETWAQYLQARGLPGECIVVEITEGLLLDTSGIVADTLLGLRDAGIQVSLDDFGTGYSSLSYLQRFDIDFIKIDQSFVRHLVAGSTDLALCNAIIAMAHALGMQVIAEGVETAQQRDLLAAAGCDYAQGYLYARPMSVSDFEAFMAQYPGA